MIFTRFTKQDEKIQCLNYDFKVLVGTVFSFY